MEERATGMKMCGMRMCRNLAQYAMRPRMWLLSMYLWEVQHGFVMGDQWERNKTLSTINHRPRARSRLRPGTIVPGRGF